MKATKITIAQILMATLVTLIGTSVLAQHYGPGGYLVPGDSHNLNPYEPNPYQPNPYQPQPPHHGGGYSPNYPGYGYGDYGPARTVRWIESANAKVDKFVGETIRIDGRHTLVNEIALRVQGSKVDVREVLVYLSNGQVINLREATGTIREGRDVRVRLDRRASLRVERITIDAVARNLIGSRGTLTVYLGLAE